MKFIRFGRVLDHLVDEHDIVAALNPFNCGLEKTAIDMPGSPGTPGDSHATYFRKAGMAEERQKSQARSETPINSRPVSGAGNNGSTFATGGSTNPPATGSGTNSPAGGGGKSPAVVGSTRPITGGPIILPPTAVSSLTGVPITGSGTNSPATGGGANPPATGGAGQTNLHGSLRATNALPVGPGYTQYQFQHMLDKATADRANQVFKDFEDALGVMAKNTLGYTDEKDIQNLIGQTRNIVYQMRNYRGPAHAILGQTEKGTLALAKDNAGRYYFLVTDPTTSPYAAYFGTQEDQFRRLGRNIMESQQQNTFGQSYGQPQFGNQTGLSSQFYFDPNQFSQMAMMMSLVNPQQAMNMLMSMYMMNYMMRMMQQRGF